MSNQGKQTIDLEWKSHGQVFIAANKQVDDIGARIMLSHGIVGDLRNVYLLVRMLNTKYSEYFGNDKEKIQTKLNNVYKLVYNVKYCRDLAKVLDRQKGRLDVKMRNNLTIYEQKRLFQLDDILKLMCANFTRSTLFPRPETTTQETQETKDIGSVM